MDLWRPTDAEIAEFWETRMTPAYVISHLRRGVVNLVLLSVGLGKSVLADRLMESDLVRTQYELVVYAAAQTRILQERSQDVMQRPTTRVLRPRPRRQCGELDVEWSRLERQGCSAYAKRSLCPSCHARDDCFWLRQFKGLDRYDTIVATQAYFRAAPLIMSQRIRAAQRKALVILDEDLILTDLFKRTLGHSDLERHRSLLEGQLSKAHVPSERLVLRSQLASMDALLDTELDPRGLKAPKVIPPETAADLQERGLARFGDEYQYLGMEVFVGLASKKYRTDDGEYGYIWKPWLGRGATILVLSAELDPLIVRHRLGRRVHCLFPPHYTQHIGTRVLNIRDRRLSAIHLSQNLRYFAVPYAQFIRREQEAGRRVLLITRKKFVRIVRDQINVALDKIGTPLLRVTPHNKWTGDSTEVPLITYGIQGINEFEHHDTALCIGAYNVPPSALDEFVNDVHRPHEQLATDISYLGGIRTGRVKGQESSPDLNDLVRRYLWQLEFNTANQAVGRVRHCTRPRLVVFCQQTELPYELEADFERFEGFRQYFQLDTERERKRKVNTCQVQSLKAQGLTQVQVAAETGLGLRTVKRRWQE